MRARLATTLALGLAVVMLSSACGPIGSDRPQSSGSPGTEASGSPAPTPGISQPPVRLNGSPDVKQVSGATAWQTEVGFSKSDGYRVSLDGPWYLAAGIESVTEPITVAALGRVADGEIKKRFRIAESSGWPALGSLDDEPIVVVARSGTAGDGSDQVIALGSGGQRLWAVAGSQLEQDPERSNLIVKGINRDRVVVRVIPNDPERAGDARIVVLDLADGSVAWWAPEQWWRATEAERGVLVSAYRGDRQRSESPDRVRGWAIKDGRELFDVPVRNQQPTDVMCSHVLRNGAVFLCGQYRPDGADPGSPWLGSAVVVKPDGSEAWRISDTVTKPVIDPRTEIVAIRPADRSLVGRQAATGKQSWKWSTEKADGSEVTLGRGYGGWLVGSGSGSAITVDAATGEVQLVNDMFALNARQIAGRRYLDISDEKLVATTGPSTPIGLVSTTPTSSDILYLERGD